MLFKKVKKRRACIWYKVILSDWNGILNVKSDVMLRMRLT